MKIFAPLYDRVARCAAHRHAARYLAGLSFIESSVFPVPPDLMLIPMILAQRARAWRLAALTTAFSVAGGVAGYFIGRYFFGLVGEPLIELYGAARQFEAVRSWYDEYGVLAVAVAGFTPVPYKLFTITSGFLSLSMPLFIAASVVGRAARFYLVAALTVWGGKRFAGGARKHAETIGWSVFALAAAVVLLYLWLRA